MRGLYRRVVIWVGMSTEEELNRLGLGGGQRARYKGVGQGAAPVGYQAWGGGCCGVIAGGEVQGVRWSGIPRLLQVSGAPIEGFAACVG